jgi:hypothetical protein
VANNHYPSDSMNTIFAKYLLDHYPHQHPYPINIHIRSDGISKNAYHSLKMDTERKLSVPFTRNGQPVRRPDLAQPENSGPGQDHPLDWVWAWILSSMVGPRLDLRMCDLGRICSGLLGLAKLFHALGWDWTWFLGSTMGLDSGLRSIRAFSGSTWSEFCPL